MVQSQIQHGNRIVRNEREKRTKTDKGMFKKE